VKGAYTVFASWIFYEVSCSRTISGAAAVIFWR